MSQVASDVKDETPRFTETKVGCGLRKLGCMEGGVSDSHGGDSWSQAHLPYPPAGGLQKQCPEPVQRPGSDVSLGIIPFGEESL